MVGDFTDDHEHSGYLYLSVEEQEVAKVSHPDLYHAPAARTNFKFGAQRDAYWNNEHFISQMNTAIKVAEFKYPHSNNNIV